MWWMHDGTLGWGWGVAGMAWMVVFWGAIIALVVWGVRRLSEPRYPGEHRATPLDIARERYARGEITREEFEQIKQDLGV